jgi:hypothetical protein
MSPAIPSPETPLWSCRIGEIVSLEQVRDYLEGEPPGQKLRLHRIEHGTMSMAAFARQSDDTFRRIQ